MKTHHKNKRIRFYDLLLDLVCPHDKKHLFCKKIAEQVIALYEQIKDRLSCGEITLVSLRKLHEEHNGNHGSLDKLELLAQACQRDLSPLLNLPYAPDIIQDFLNVSGNADESILIDISSVARHGETDIATVTLTVSSLERFKSLATKGKLPVALLTTWLKEKATQAYPEAQAYKDE